MPALTEFQIDEPGRYLRTDQSCSTFNQAMPDGSPIYAAYLGPFEDGVTACQARMDNTSTSTYVKHLDGANDGPFYCICAYSVSELPLLNTTEDETSSGERRFWMVELQHILFDTGHNPQQLFGGNFGSQTVEMVRSYQRTHDLKASGAIDAATWESMRGSKCS